MSEARKSKRLTNIQKKELKKQNENENKILCVNR